MIYRSGSVYVQNELAGTIEDTSDGYIFTYDSEYAAKDNAVAVSLTMPVCNKPYVSNILFPFFDGLIPEGWLLDVVIDSWKINPKDRFGLLMVACRDCIGDISIREI